MNLNQRELFSWIYLSLALLGALLPMLANIDFMRTYGPGFDILQFIKLANSNPASQSLSRDLIIFASTFVFWMINESRRLSIKHLWIVLLSSVTIAIAFAAPLFLFLRERRMIEIDSQGHS